MELRVLGCHGGETPKHKTSSFLVDGSIALDAGAVTSMLALDEQRKVETVLVSHAHLDHIKDLATLADNRCQQGGPTVRIVGVQATIDILRKHFFNDLLWPDFSKIPTPMGPTVAFDVIEPEVPFELGGGANVTAVMVNHTIDTSAFVLETKNGCIAYSGDTGPTERLWEVLSSRENLRALLMEVSFPDEHHQLAKVSGHHTPETLADDLVKLTHAHVPTLLYHIKPVFERAVEKQLTSSVRADHVQICRLGDQFIL